MDTTDPNIEFDENGVCNHCEEEKSYTVNLFHFLKRKKDQLKLLANKIILDRRNKRYDCITRLSGSVDSTYIALLVKEL
ncbi:MAG TPA: hypothetical protein PK746_04045 [Spirochaetales bacterium]|nr:hypothetical protein [Spirochaetales bacterium]